MKKALVIGLVLIAAKCFSQEKTVSGIVFDKETRERIASVNIHDLTDGISVYDNLKGEFSLIAKEGDQLIITRLNYKPDTIKLKSYESQAVYLQRLTIQLKEVSVRDSVMTPEKRLEATKREYSKVYGSLAYGDYLTTPSNGPAGLSIDALYNAISREGRNAAHLRQIIQSDYEQNVIDYRFNRTFVGHVTGLKDERLTAFIFRYRPGFYTTKTLSDYEFISMIRSNLRRFLRNQRTYSQQPLLSK
jgi:hypothetical protein